jgi:hypothetical protein
LAALKMTISEAALTEIANAGVDPVHDARGSEVHHPDPTGEPADQADTGRTALQ